MPFRLALAVSAALVLCVAPARGDSVDGSPIRRIDRQPPASVRGSPAILFEDRGGRGPLDGCPLDGADTGPPSCSAGGGF